MPHLGPAGREYPTERNGRIEIWGTDDHDNFWFVSDEGPATGGAPKPQPQPVINPYVGVQPTPLVGGQGYSEAMQQAQLAWQKALNLMEMSGLIPPDLAKEMAGYGGLTGGGAGQSALDYIVATKPDLIAALRGFGWDIPDTPEGKRAAIEKWFREVSPEGKTGMSLEDFARSIGWQGASTSTTGLAGSSPAETGLAGAPAPGSYNMTAGQPNEMEITGGAAMPTDFYGEIPRGTPEDWGPFNTKYTLPMRQWLQSLRQWQQQQDFETGTRFPWEQEQFRQNMGERQRQFDIGTLASKSGPSDWIQRTILETGFDPRTSAGSLADAFSRQSPYSSTPGGDSWEMALQRYLQQNPRGGTLGEYPFQGQRNFREIPRTGDITPALGAPAQQNEPMAYTGPPQRYPWEGQRAEDLGTPRSWAAGLAQRDRAQRGPVAVAAPMAESPNAPWWQNLPVTQGHQIGAQGFSRWTPSQQARQASLWNAQGKVPEDEWQKMRKSWLSAGPVAGSTRYRMTG